MKVYKIGIDPGKCCFLTQQKNKGIIYLKNREKFTVNIIENKSEELFKELCNQQYLKGFVFHSPKYNDPTEKEAGDVVLWIRDCLIVFEIVWRNPSSNQSTRSFIRRVSEKRKQLEGDFITYRDKHTFPYNFKKERR